MTTTADHDELQKLFADADLAREHIEKLRWTDGVICPHCGAKDEHYPIMGKATSKRPARKGLYKCKACGEQFTVTVGTIFESSKIPLNKWLHVFHLVCSSKKGMSAHQIHRTVGVTYKSAWFMVHRIRYAMEQRSLDKMSGIVEVDETYVGGKLKGGKAGRGSENKTPVVVVVRRNGESRAVRMDHVSGKNLKAFIQENADKHARIMTDSYAGYKKVGESYDHQTVDHSAGEYVRGLVHTNTAESWFSLLKRGMVGTFHHVSRKHLNRYATEFAFRWNYRKTSDYERTIAAIKIVGGKRLMYKHLIE